MGLILDTSALIAGERGGRTVRQMLQHVRSAHGETEVAISAISVIEFTHGIYRAKTDADRKRRQSFSEEVYRDLIVHPVSMEVAQLAGRIEGEQAAIGNLIAIRGPFDRGDSIASWL